MTLVFTSLLLFSCCCCYYCGCCIFVAAVLCSPLMINRKLLMLLFAAIKRFNHFDIERNTFSDSRRGIPWTRCGHQQTTCVQSDPYQVLFCSVIALEKLIRYLITPSRRGSNSTCCILNSFFPNSTLWNIKRL